MWELTPEVLMVENCSRIDKRHNLDYSNSHRLETYLSMTNSNQRSALKMWELLQTKIISPNYNFKN